MAKVTIYTRDMCGFCVRAKKLLDGKGVDYTEFNYSEDPTIRREMIAKANGANTFPQVFIGSEHVGGCNELFMLERRGQLDPLLSADL